MTPDTQLAEVSIDTKPVGVFEIDLKHARRLLDKALKDCARAERGTVEPLYRPEIRWEMVRLARRMLSED